VTRWLKIDAVMQDVVYGLHLASYHTQIWTAQDHCFLVGRKSSNVSPHAFELNSDISGEVPAWWLCTFLLFHIFMGKWVLSLC